MYIESVLERNYTKTDIKNESKYIYDIISGYMK